MFNDVTFIEIKDKKLLSPTTSIHHIATSPQKKHDILNKLSDNITEIYKIRNDRL